MILLPLGRLPGQQPQWLDTPSWTLPLGRTRLVSPARALFWTVFASTFTRTVCPCSCAVSVPVPRVYAVTPLCLDNEPGHTVHHHPEKSPKPPGFLFFFSAPNSISIAGAADLTPGPGFAPEPVPGPARYLPTKLPSSSAFLFFSSFCALLSPFAPRLVPSHVVRSFSRKACASARFRCASSDWS